MIQKNEELAKRIDAALSEARMGECMISASNLAAIRAAIASADVVPRSELKAALAKLADAEESLTIAYMAGYDDGKRSALARPKI